MRTPGRIAVVRLSALGDVALASVLVEALRGRAEVLFVVRESFAALYRGDPRLAGLVAVSADSSPVRDAIRSFAPDVVLDLQGTLASRRLLRGLGESLSVRVRKDTVRRRLAVVGWRGSPGLPVYRRYLDALARVTGRIEDAHPRLHVGDEARFRAVAHLPEDRRWVGLAPGSRWANKRWPLERYLDLASHLVQDRSVGVGVLVGPGEESIAAAFAVRFDRDRGVRILRPALEELPSLLERLVVLVTGDSGPMHVAEAAGTPVIALFGPTTRHFGFSPFLASSRVIERALRCRPCHVHGGNRCPLIHHRCMNDISVSHVHDTTVLFLGDAGQASRLGAR